MNQEDVQMKVSITIPCRNEAKYIARCLNSIVSCTYSKERLNVYVCDGNSNDRTQEIISEFQIKYPFVHLLKNEKQTTPHALNLGLKADDSDIKIILGAHAEIAPNYIEKCIETFKISKQIACVGGVLENITEDEDTEVIAMAMSSGFGVGNAYFRTGNYSGYVDTVAFGAYKKEVFEKIGFFDEELIRNQDDEFNYRLLKAGYKIYLSSEIRAAYYVRSSFSKLFKQYFQYGYWKVFVNKKHQSVTTFRQLVPLFFVLFLLFSCVFFLIPIPFFRWIYPIGIILYFTTSSAFAVKMAGSVNVFFKIIYVFFILHFAYGFGYLLGIKDFFIFNTSPKHYSLSR